VGLLLFLFLCFNFSFTHQRKVDNPVSISRLDLLHSIIQHGTLNIDRYHSNTPGKALYRGHYYSDKAPGVALMALPAFALSAVAFQFLPIDLDSDAGWFFSSWITCVLTLGILTALGGVLCFRWLQSYVEPKVALVTTLGLYLCVALPYTTMLFSHALTIAFVSAALWSTRQVQLGGDARSARRSGVVAGISLGAICISELTAGLVVVGLIGYYFYVRRRMDWHFVGSFALVLLVLPMWGWICYGSPFRIGYDLQTEFEEMKKGFYGIRWPSAENAWNLLMSPSRGLFVWAPFFVLSVFGFRHLKPNEKGNAIFFFILVVAQVAIISGYFDWKAGPTIGPRYLSPALPLLAFTAACFGRRRFGVLCLFATGSIVFSQIITNLDAGPSSLFHNPLSEYFAEQVRDFDLNPNLFTLLGIPKVASAILFGIVNLGLLALMVRALNPASHDARAPSPTVALSGTSA
jgi:hypothetical protein